MYDNPHWQLARTPPEGWPTDGDFRYEIEAAPDPGPNQALTRTLYLSLDPYQWGRRRGGIEVPGEVCHGRTVSQVTASRSTVYREGDYIFNTNGWQTYGLVGEGVSHFNYMHPRQLDATLAPISTALGVLGMLGLTAYAGLVAQCKPQAGETVVVSAASGGVGQVVGQIASLLGCRVVGIAGAQHKCNFVRTELGFDSCVSHRAPNLRAALTAACPDGVDIYFENVGGAVFEAVLPCFNHGARISLCGMISQYGNTDGKDAGEVWQAMGAATFARQQMNVHRLFVGNYVDSHQAEFLERMGAWVGAGRIRYREDLSSGLEQAPAAFAAMLEGRNFGKTLVGVGDDPSLDSATTLRRQSGNTLGG
ncbi:MAG: NADP-dependent oxidoreductase [Gammaproteobacteria bacterium]|nr:NADP-dependent oxidoreductase [Gammaproteobacteria bacterium]